MKSNSLKDLGNLVDSFNENKAVLYILGFRTDQWCFIFFNMLFRDNQTRTNFEIDFSKVCCKVELLQNYCRALESMEIKPAHNTYFFSSPSKDARLMHV